MQKKLIHVCYRVENLEKSIAFYEEAMGYHVTSKRDFPEDAFTLVYLKDDASGIEIELTYNYNHGPYDLGDGYGHFAVYVDDLEKSFAQHEKMGIISQELTTLGGDTQFYFIKDPDGYQIEVIGPKK